MKLKQLWKKANRGVILAGICIIVLACYITIDKITFNSEKPQINQQMKSYIEDYLTAIVTSDKVIQNNGVWDNEDRNAQKDSMTNFVSKYWTDTNYSSSSMNYLIDKSSFLDVINLVYDNSLKNQTGFISKIDHLISKVSISKNGPSAAYYTCTLKVTLTSTGAIDFPTIYGSTMNTDNSFYNGEKPEAMLTQTVVYEFNLEVELLREKGEWKISTFQPASYSSYSASATNIMEVA